MLDTATEPYDINDVFALHAFRDSGSKISTKMGHTGSISNNCFVDVDIDGFVIGHSDKFEIEAEEYNNIREIFIDNEGHPEDTKFVIRGGRHKGAHIVSRKVFELNPFDTDYITD